MTITLDLSARQGPFTVQAKGPIGPGITSVFGPSGCGKTTLLRAICGLTKARGSFTFKGADLNALPPHKRRIAMVFQDSRLFDHLTVQGNLRYAQKRASTPVNLDRISALAGITPLLDRKPATLSGGERQRVALARALASAPRLLLLDEPLTALDAPARRDLIGVIDQLRGQLPIMHVSHDISEIAQLADDLWLMRQGRVTHHGPIQQVLADPHRVADLGTRVAGAVVIGHIQSYDAADDLTEVLLGLGHVFLPGNIGAVGTPLRLRIPAHDVTLMLDAPRGSSALGHLPVEITDLAQGGGPGVAVGLRSGSVDLLARITRRSAQALNLHKGMTLHAMLKATALSPADTGR